MSCFKKIILILFISALAVPSVSAFDSKYTVHTSLKDVNYKKSKSLEWYSDNIDKDKFYWYDCPKHVKWLKNRSLRWYTDNITNEKFYFVHGDHELAFTKKKALRWYSRNSQ
jgi:hypothetical protein